jgi:hypothetical protein
MTDAAVLVHVDEARQEGDVSQVDPLISPRCWHIRRRIRPPNPFLPDHDGRVLQHVRSRAIQKPLGGDDRAGVSG